MTAFARKLAILDAVHSMNCELTNESILVCVHYEHCMDDDYTRPMRTTKADVKVLLIFPPILNTYAYSIVIIITIVSTEYAL